MRYAQEIEILESEWSPENGFFWRIREGRFVPDEFQRTLGKIATFSIDAESDVPRRLISLLWYIPLFMQWQIERVRENGGDVDGYSKAVTAMTNEVERLLGVP